MLCYLLEGYASRPHVASVELVDYLTHL